MTVTNKYIDSLKAQKEFLLEILECDSVAEAIRVPEGLSISIHKLMVARVAKIDKVLESTVLKSYDELFEDFIVNHHNKKDMFINFLEKFYEVPLPLPKKQS
jgi:hypothetical protein